MVGGERKNERDVGDVMASNMKKIRASEEDVGDDFKFLKNILNNMLL